MQLRHDRIDDLGLAWTADRDVRSTVRDDVVRQSNVGLFGEVTSQWRPWIRTVLGIRGDGYFFDVASERAVNSGDGSATILTPKASVIFTPVNRLELYLSGGHGFHSNDARGAVISVDPATGEPVEPVDPLVRSRGGEIGIRTSPVDGLRSTLTVWQLELDSELLFVGDAGGTEPSDRSRRRGITLANFYRVTPGLSLDADISLAHARLLEVGPEEDHIPGALENVVTAGIAWAPATGPLGSVRVRHFGAYPLVEDNSVRAEAATLVNAQAGYRFGARGRITATLLNVFDTTVADIQYFYESRLPGEPAGGVEDVHFHPVEPRQLRLGFELTL